jgi:hypothetical protein
MPQTRAQQIQSQAPVKRVISSWEEVLQSEQPLPLPIFSPSLLASKHKQFTQESSELPRLLLRLFRSASLQFLHLFANHATCAFTICQDYKKINRELKSPY